MLSKYYNYNTVFYILCTLIIVNSSSVATENPFHENIICQVNCLQNHAKEKNQVNSCQDNCNRLLKTKDIELKQNPADSEFSPPTLHCLTEDTITVIWQPWRQQNPSRPLVYFVEICNKNLDRIISTTTRNSNITLENLSPLTEYIIRLLAIESFAESSDLTVLGPVFSPWISTLAPNYTPQPVNNISLRSLEFVQGKLHATIQWTANKEQPACYYELVYFSHAGSGNYQQIEFLEPQKRFETMIEESEFDSNFSIGIMAKSRDWERESLTTSAYFITPSCLEVVGNLNNCAPAQPSNLISDEELVNVNTDISQHTTCYDISLSWDHPKFIPDNYIITLHILSLKLNLTVGGNETKAVFKNVVIGLQYLVSVVACSNGGCSEPARVQRQMTQLRIPPSMKRVWIITIVGLVAIVVFSLFGAAFYIYHRRAKRKTYERRRKYFEELEEKTPKNLEFITSGTSLINNDSYQESDKWELRPERLVLQRVLGEGAFGLVRRAWLWDEKDSKSTEVAVKMLKDAPSSEQCRQFMHEIEIMKTVGPHPHLVSLIGCCTRPQSSKGISMMLVVEFCALGDLQNYLRGVWDRMTSVVEPSNIKYADLVSHANSEESPNLIINKLYEIDSMAMEDNLKPSDLLSFARQIIVGMQFLTNMKVLHRDLAARNVLVCADKTVKIADFGLSRDVYKENMYKKLGNGRLPIRWLAIESLTHQIYTTQSDVWSFGILLWEIVTLGGNPYPSIPTSALLKFLRSGYRMERPSNCGQELYSIMLSCWKVRPKDRPTFTELKKKIEDILLNLTTSKYLDLDIFNSTEFASLRSPIKESASLTIRSPNTKPDRYVHPVMLNNAKKSPNATEVPIIIK